MRILQILEEIKKYKYIINEKITILEQKLKYLRDIVA